MKKEWYEVHPGFASGKESEKILQKRVEQLRMSFREKMTYPERNT